jgi:hypothetical protein
MKRAEIPRFVFLFAHSRFMGSAKRHAFVASTLSG